MRILAALSLAAVCVDIVNKNAEPRKGWVTSGGGRWRVADGRSARFGANEARFRPWLGWFVVKWGFWEGGEEIDG